MKNKIIFILLMLACFAASAQTKTPVLGRWEYQWVYVDSGSYQPHYSTIGLPPASLGYQLVFNTDSGKLQYSNLTNWVTVGANIGGSPVNSVFGRVGAVAASGSDYSAYYLGITAAAGGDLSGNYPNPTVKGILGANVGSPVSGDAMYYNGSTYVWKYAYSPTDTLLTLATRRWTDSLFGTLPGGSTNSNIGSGYRWAVPGTNNVKTIFTANGILTDSSSNTNALTLKGDTTYFPRWNDTTAKGSNTLVTLHYLNTLFHNGSGTTWNGSNESYDLGGTLTNYETIAEGAYGLTLTGSSNTSPALSINYTPSSNLSSALQVSSSSYGGAGNFYSSGGAGVLALQAQAVNNGIGEQISSIGTNLVGEYNNVSATGIPYSTIQPLITYTLQNVGGLLTGSGTEFDYFMSDSSGSSNVDTAMRTIIQWTNAVSGSQTDNYQIWLDNAAVKTQEFVLSGAGAVRFNQLPSLGGSTDSTTYKPVGMDASGNLHWMAHWIGSGSSGGSTNTNIGSGYRWGVPGTNNIKTTSCIGCVWDSTTNTNQLTLTIDTTALYGYDGILINSLIHPGSITISTDSTVIALWSYFNNGNGTTWNLSNKSFDQGGHLAFNYSVNGGHLFGPSYDSVKHFNMHSYDPSNSNSSDFFFSADSSIVMDNSTGTSLGTFIINSAGGATYMAQTNGTYSNYFGLYADTAIMLVAKPGVDTSYIKGYADSLSFYQKNGAYRIYNVPTGTALYALGVDANNHIVQSSAGGVTSLTSPNATITFSGSTGAVTADVAHPNSRPSTTTSSSSTTFNLVAGDIIDYIDATPASSSTAFTVNSSDGTVLVAATPLATSLNHFFSGYEAGGSVTITVSGITSSTVITLIKRQ